MSQWLVLQVLSLIMANEPGAIGATAPTEKRLGTMIKAVNDLIPVDASRDGRPGAWGSFFVDAKELRFRSGHVIQFRSTQRQSAAAGSPVQGYTWKRAGMDEAQDQVEQGAYPDIEARLRGARESMVMATATAKDSPTWRTWRDSLSEDWTVERIPYTQTPFVHPEHWERLKRNVSAREWQRRALAMDVGPELQVYTSWSREENLRPVPQLGARDVTADVLRARGYGPGNVILIGHDPGQIVDYSVFLKAFLSRGQTAPRWFVVRELVTSRTTTEEHAQQLRQILRDEYGCYQLDAKGRPLLDSPVARIHVDPYGDSDNKTDRSVYQVFRHLGLDARSAAYKHGKGSGRVPKEAGIEMVNRLLCSASGERRLFVACDDRRVPVAPRLVEALEMSERDEAGKAETQRKGKKDLSHYPAATRYALWPLERHISITPSAGAVEVK